MFLKNKTILMMIIVVATFFVLLAGCQPAALPLTPTTTMPVSLTATLPFTSTNPPLPTASETSLPPTAVPSFTPTLVHTIPPFEVRKEIDYAANGDADQTLSIYLPKQENRKPLTLLVYGGEGFPELVEYFAESAYPVIAFNSRDDSYLTEIQDGFCALAWAHANANIYGFDPEQIVPVGGSMWGGTAAILGLVDNPAPYLEECPYALPETGRVRGVIALAGVFDYSEVGDFFDGFIEAISAYMGGAPDQVPENWAAASAITWVKGDEPPFLLVHGKADTNVSLHQSEKFAAALEEVGTEVELVLLPGVDHYNSVKHPDVFEALQSFLDRLE